MNRPSLNDLKETHLPLLGFLHSIEKGLIEEALARTTGNRARAARLLGIQRSTLVEKCRRFGLTRKREQREAAQP